MKPRSTRSDEQTIHLVLPCGPSAPRLAREALGPVLRRRGCVIDATLVVSELVTNVVEHAACNADETITLDARLIGDCVRIAVHASGRPAVTSTLASGLGLRLVAQIARAWGSERADGRLLWAELAV